MYCSNCGGKISENDKFCPACGKEVKFEFQNTRDGKETPKKKKHYVGIILLLIIVFVCVSLAVLALTKVLPLQGRNIFSLQQTDQPEDHTTEIEEAILEAEQYVAEAMAQMPELTVAAVTLEDDRLRVDLRAQEQTVSVELTVEGG